MKILGFNSTHDASAALVIDGEIICAVEEERFTRSKHYYGFPEHSIDACLAAGGIEFKDLDHVSFYWDVRKGLWSFLFHILRHFPKTLAYFSHQPGIYGSFRNLPKYVREKYGFTGEFHFLDHHRNHIASSFWPSPFEDAAAMTVDGTGEWETSVLAKIHAGGRIEILKRSTYPHSIGKLWEMVTQYLGFRPNSGEGKVMGLAPYGRPTFVEDFRKLLTVDDDARIHLDLSMCDFHYGRERKFSKRFIERFGPAREPESAMEEVYEDVAYALQAVTEECLLKMAGILHDLTDCPRLVMAGGVSLNSVANGRIQHETPFEELYIQPSAGDAGAALGSALRVWHEVLGNGDTGRHRMINASVGPGYTDDEMRSAIEEKGLESERLDDPCREAAKSIAAGKIIAWFQGRMEYGPRALGNRSILADPRTEEMKDVLNARVKFREGFRPFAPAIPAEVAGEYFDTRGAEAPFMLKVFTVRPEKRDVIPAVTHVDGTARVQTVRREQNERYYDLITAFGELTGVPVVLNTSFNVRGEPIVTTPADAVRCFSGTDIDELFLGNYRVRK